MKPVSCKRGLCSFTSQLGRKRALALGGVGPRSAIIKRAISRRVQTKNQLCKDIDTHDNCSCCLTNIITKYI